MMNPVLGKLLKEEYIINAVSDEISILCERIREICGSLVYIQEFVSIPYQGHSVLVVHIIKGSSEDTLLQLAFGDRLEAC